MGLDMYLTAKRYMWYNETELKEQIGAPLDLPEGIEIEQINVRAAYWRKANHIHAWFVQNVQDGVDDCKPYYVTTDQLRALIVLCKNILAEPELAPTLLPTKNGCFFGSTEYDDYYMDDLRSTVLQLERALQLKGDVGPRMWDFEYTASW